MEDGTVPSLLLAIIQPGPGNSSDGVRMGAEVCASSSWVVSWEANRPLSPHPWALASDGVRLLHMQAAAGGSLGAALAGAQGHTPAVNGSVGTDPAEGHQPHLFLSESDAVVGGHTLLRRFGILSYWALTIATALVVQHRLVATNNRRGPPLTVVRKGYHILALALFIPAMAWDPSMLAVSLAVAFALLLALEAVRSTRVVPAVARALEAIG
ncbi:dolichol kinase [Haematococcus lacustris]|uniref:dolichol kinase n=1 Tax=Haematococcus lacustris TaxID=44745 RepID=A0A699YRD8_HAELA|nr:dolichol kinase [Haematococcus lacustris]